MKGAATLAALAACGGTTGTFDLSLTTAPGSPLLATIQRARLTLSQPFQQRVATRGPGGALHLSLDVPADGPTGFVTFEGYDAAGTLLGWGRSGPLPIAAIDAAITIYVAPPQSLAAAPVALEPARSELGVARFGFGVMLFGGAAAGGAPVATVAGYDVYRHDLVAGEALPAARAAPAVGAGDSGFAYVLGGRDAGGRPTGTLWRFDTTIAPAGAWRALDDLPMLAQAGASAARIGPDTFLVTGDPPVTIDGPGGLLIPAPTLPALAGTASAFVRDLESYAVFVGEGSGATGVVRRGPNGIAEASAPPSARRTGHGAAVTSDAQVVVLGGAVDGVLTRTALVADPVRNLYREVPDALATARLGAAVASNGDVILVAGGRDASGAIVPDAEVLDARTLAPIATLAMVAPRAAASATALGNGQILIAGGVDATGAPVGTLELYTPAAP